MIEIAISGAIRRNLFGVKERYFRGCSVVIHELEHRFVGSAALDRDGEARASPTDRSWDGGACVVSAMNPL